MAKIKSENGYEGISDRLSRIETKLDTLGKCTIPVVESKNAEGETIMKQSEPNKWEEKLKPLIQKEAGKA